MKQGSGIRHVLTASLLAMAAAIGMPVGTRALPPPTIRQMLGGQKEDERKRWRRTRAQIMNRALTWRGIGMFSRGPRWPKTTWPVVTRQGIQASDGTRYVIFTDGSWRLQARGPQGQAAVKRHKRLRQRLAHAGLALTVVDDGPLARWQAERQARAARRLAAA